MKYIGFALLIFLIIGVLAFVTFNPITHYSQIHQTKAILAKVKTYDNRQFAPPPSTRNLAFWQGVDFDKTENDFIEKTGFSVVKNAQNEYIGVISSGFDDTIFYDTAKDCWYGTKPIIGLAICHHNPSEIIKEKS